MILGILFLALTCGLAAATAVFWALSRLGRTRIHIVLGVCTLVSFALSLWSFNR